MFDFIIILIVVILYRIIMNYCLLIEANELSDLYKKHAKESKFDYIQEKQDEIVKVFKKAGLVSPLISYTRPIGWMQIETGKAQIFDNIATPQRDVVENVLRCFSSSQGIFKKRIKESLDPFFWFETILFLPSKAVNYLGFNGDSKFSKFLNVLMWIIGILVSLYPDEIKSFIGIL